MVLPEGEDDRILAAARRLADEGRVRPVVLVDSQLLARLRDDRSLAQVQLIDPAVGDLNARYGALYQLRRPNPKPAIAQRLMRKPLYFAGMMVAAGDAEAMLAGVLNPTARVIEAGMMTLGLAAGIHNASSFFQMILPARDGGRARSLIFADCAVNIDPDAQTLADIAIASAQSCRHVLDVTPRVALLSFSTHGSASHASIERITAAVRLVRQRAPELAIDGELQADAALSELVAAKKVKLASEVAGRANVLVFPDLNSGNIAYKLTQYLGGARAIGPILQGFAKPISDLSRGASVDDIVATAYLLLKANGLDRATES